MRDSVGSIGVELRVAFLYLISLCVFHVSLDEITKFVVPNGSLP